MDQHTINVAVLDSSFNPPHICHQAYLESIAYSPIRPLQKESENRDSLAIGCSDNHTIPLDGSLLLLGASNCDKKVHGATLPQRLEMMEAMAKDICIKTQKPIQVGETPGTSGCDNIATALCNTPRFVDKAVALYRFIHRRANIDYNEKGFAKDNNAKSLDTRLYFLMGWDTLIRFFNPKYYTAFPKDLGPFFSNGGRIVFSRRGGYTDEEVERFIKDRTPSGLANYVYEIELPRDLAYVSSTNAREAVSHCTGDTSIIPKYIQDIITRDRIYQP